MSRRLKVSPEHERDAVLQLGTAAIVERVLEITAIERLFRRVHTRAEAIDTIRELAANR